MQTVRSMCAALALGAVIAAPAFAEPPYAGTSPQKSGVSAPQKSATSAEKKEDASVPGERAAFRWESSTARVKQTQEALNKHGANLKADGVMGEDTRKELRGYQRRNNLTETGRIDDATAKSLGIEMK